MLRMYRRVCGKFNDRGDLTLPRNPVHLAMMVVGQQRDGPDELAS